MAEQNIEPFAYQKSTNINEHNQMVDKINELVDGTNELDNKRVNTVAQSFDDETRILATTLTTVDGTEISGSVYVPGGGDGGDIAIDTIDYNESVPDVINYIRTKYAEGTYNCNINIKASLLNGSVEGDDKISFNATQFTLSHYSHLDISTTYQIQFEGAGESAVNGTARWITLSYSPSASEDTKYSATVNIYRYVSSKDAYENQGWNINQENGLRLKGYVIKGIKGAAITPYTASTGIKIDDENSTIAVDTDVIATVDSVKEVDTKADTAKTTAETAITNADTANTNALKAYKSAYVENNTMTFEKGNGDTDTIALPTGGSYTAGDGITISDNEIAVDTSVIATKAETAELESGISANRFLINGSYCDVGISDNVMTFTAVDGQQKEITIPSSGETTNSTTIYITPINYVLTLSTPSNNGSCPLYINGIGEYGTGAGAITAYGLVVNSGVGVAYRNSSFNIIDTFTDYLDKLVTIKTNLTSGTLRLGVNFIRFSSDSVFSGAVDSGIIDYLEYDLKTKALAFTSSDNLIYTLKEQTTSSYVSLILRSVVYIA